VGLLPQTWWEAHGAWHLTPVLSLTARTGHLASDVLLGVRGGSYNTVGLRLDLLQHAAPREPISILRGATQIVRESEATVHLYFTMPPRTRQVSISSDLTGWLPVNLSRNDDGRWEIVLAAKAGVHRLNVRADGGPWFVPTGLPTSDDGFGAKVGLLVLDP
jgi:hypothetical protein